MSDEHTSQTIETAEVLPSQTETQEAPPLSIQEHGTLYGKPKDALPADEQATLAATKAALEAKAAHHSEAQRREKDGTFRDGKVRHRAQSQQARPEDVPRIRELTARARTAEDRLSAAEAEVARLKTQHASPAHVAAAERKVDQAEQRIPDKDDPEPKEDDPTYEGDYGKYLRDVTRWETRQALKADRAESAKQAEQAQRAEAHTATIRTFAERLTTAKERYADFEETLAWDAPWLAQSGEPHPGYEALHDFILLDEQGADVLHYLRSHPEEVDALLRVPPLQQVKRLTLLGQRFASSLSDEAGATGAAPRPTVVMLPPKPLTPVRTEAHRAGDSPPPTDGSLSIAEHGKHFGTLLRRR